MTEQTTAVAVQAAPKQSLLARVAERYGVEPQKMLGTLTATAFRSDKPISNEQMMALLIVAEQYHLNPFTKEIFAFPDKGGIVPVVSVDGWARIINEHPMLDGLEFEYHGPEASPTAITCIIWRKDRQKPIRVTEFMAECKRGTQPWNSHPRRMLRHKALIQCARLAFGFAGIYDEDEAQRIVHGGMVERVEPESSSANRVRNILDHQDPAPAEVIEQEPAAPAEPPAPEPSGKRIDAALLQDYLERIKSAKDADQAGEFLDEARDLFAPEQHQTLIGAYRVKWSSKD